MLHSIIKLTKKLISCVSISPYDGGCQKIISKYLKNIGFQIKEMNYNKTSNLWAWKGEGKTLVFAGHTDVVPPGDITLWKYHPFKPVIINNILYGRGTVDMKGALASMLIATNLFLKKYPTYKGKIAFLITSDEESDAIDGTKKVIEKLLQKKEKIENCIIGEPTSKVIVGDTIKIGRRGSLTATLIIYGIQGHVAYPHFAKNPIHSVIPCLKDLINNIWDIGNDFFPPTNMQITKINVKNISSNTIPASCKIEFNFRFGNQTTYLEIQEKTKKIIKKYKLSYQLDWNLNGNPFLTKHGNLLKIAINSIKNYNIEPILSTDGGTSDGRFICKTGAKIIEIGLKNSMIHKINECVDVYDLEILSKIYLKILENFF